MTSLSEAVDEDQLRPGAEILCDGVRAKIYAADEISISFQIIEGAYDGAKRRLLRSEMNIISSAEEDGEEDEKEPWQNDE